MANKIDPDTTYNTTQTAQLVFGRTREWLYKNRGKLEGREHFPVPISRVGQPRWSGAALLEWLKRQQPPGQETAPAGVGQDYWDAVMAARTKALPGKPTVP